MARYAVNDVIRSVSPGDMAFFPSIVKALAHSLEADIVFVAKVSDDYKMASTLAVYSAEDEIEPFDYELADTPCARVIRQGNSICSFNMDVQQCFPEDLLLVEMGVHSYLGAPLRDSKQRAIGVLVALFKGAIDDSEQAEFVFQLFSGMVARELVLIEKNRELRIANQVFQYLDEAIVLFDPDLNIALANRAFERITGYSRAELVGQSLFSPQLLGGNKTLAQTILDSLKASGTWVGEIIGRRKGGLGYTVHAQIRVNYDRNSSVANYIGVLSDITSKKDAEKTIHLQANYDSLTGLPNRQLYNDRLDQAIRIAARKQKRFAVVFLDIDLFKSINDSLGHSWGDALLAEVAQRLKRALRSSDTVARFGGDEFTFVIDPIDRLSDVIAVLSHISDTLAEPFQLRDSRTFITSSIGVAFYPEDGHSREQLIAHADQAMYAAKAGGRNQYQLFTREMHRAIEEKLALKNALQEAILNKSIGTHFQFIENLARPQHIKLEVLARWQHCGQWVAPDVFIAIAEEFNLIGDLDDVILERACAAAAELGAAGAANLTLCINRSPQELNASQKPVQRWLDIIAAHGLEPGQFDIELTENVFAKNSDGHFEVLAQLSAAGFGISIDDFGSGYCSLGYLTKFPINTIKIDKSFVDDLGHGAGEGNSQSAIVNAIMAMAVAMGKQVVAEGVECRRQFEALKQIGCEQFQGYYFNRPTGLDDLIKQLRGRGLLKSDA